MRVSSFVMKRMHPSPRIWSLESLDMERGESPFWKEMTNLSTKPGAPSTENWRGVDQIHIKPGAMVLCLGAASGTSVFHVSDVIGLDGLVYAVEFSNCSGYDLINLAKKRSNIIPVVENARHPHKHHMLSTRWMSSLPTWPSQIKPGWWP